MKEHISCDFICKFNGTTRNSKQKLNNKTCQCECKNYHNCEKIIVGIQAQVFLLLILQ